MHQMLDGTTSLSDCNKRAAHDSLSTCAAWAVANSGGGYGWATLQCAPSVSPTASPSASPSTSPTASPTRTPFAPAVKEELRAALAACDADQTQVLATYGVLSTWDVTAVADFSFAGAPYGLLAGLTHFNEELSEWDVSAVTDMGAMFSGASSYNQPIAFDTGSVTSMSALSTSPPLAFPIFLSTFPCMAGTPCSTAPRPTTTRSRST
jgi:hypothetical protein